MYERVKEFNKMKKREEGERGEGERGGEREGIEGGGEEREIWCLGDKDICVILGGKLSLSIEELKLSLR